MANHVQSLSRALNILETLASSQKGMGISDLSRRLELPPSTVHRLLATLSSKGYVTHVSDGRYHLGHKVVEMGRTFLENFELSRIVRPHLEAVSHKTGETANLVVLDDDEAFYLDKVDSSCILMVFSRIGRRAPLYCTAVGKILLSGFSKERLEGYLKKTELKAFTSNTITSAQGLRRELEAVRAPGYAYDWEECEVGARCVAVPLKGFMGRVIAALGISGPAVRLDRQALERAAEYLLEASAQISAQLK